jgi:hypothetical protein
MFGRLLSRDKEVLGSLARLADCAASAATSLQQVFTPSGVEDVLAAIRARKHEAAAVAHQLDVDLDSVFLTPFDREDVHKLSRQLESVVRLVAETAEFARVFHIPEPRAPAHDLCAVVTRATHALRESVAHVKKDTALVLQHCETIRREETEGDAIHILAIGALFDGSNAAMTVLKWKELYDMLERAIHECRHAAGTLERIALKRA